MPITSPIPFVAAYVNHDTCELFRNGDNITAYIPTRSACVQELDMDTANYVTATLIAQAMGLQVTWGI